MLVHWIWLATRQGLNDRAKLAVYEHFQSPEDAFFADTDAYRQVEGLQEGALEALGDKSLGEAQRILEECTDKNIRILTYQDAAYPVRLKNIPDPPLVLYYKGRLPDLDGSPLIGVVGTRKASSYGLTVAKRMGYQIAKCGGVLVSGMAFGIDGVSAASALSADGMVIGVLGSGADIVYPVSNRGLFADTESRGCLLSEFPPGTPPYGWNFPKRNRLISGLSCGVLVVEAPERSGALITARQAAEQGRDVFVVPGNIDVKSCVGSNALLRDGAIAVSSGWDVISEYAHLYPHKIHRFDKSSRETAYPDEIARLEIENKPMKVAQKPRLLDKMKPSKSKKEKKVIDKKPAEPYIDGEKSLPALSGDEQAVVEQLKQGQRLTDDVIAASGLPTGKALGVITMLEVKGVIQKLPGNRLSLK